MLVIFQIILYFICCFFVYIIYVNNKSKNFPFKKVVVISLIFMLYNLIITNIQGGDGVFLNLDRSNYAFEFLGYRETSVGLMTFFKLMKIFTSNFYIVLYIITFICCLINFYCLLNDKNVNKYSLIFFLLTDFVFFTFFSLKQCFTCSFATLMFYIINNKKYTFENVICIICLYFAISFHSTGYILLPLIIVFCFFNKKSLNIYLIIIIFFISLLFFDEILIMLSTIFSNIIISEKIKLYFFTSEFNSRFIIFIKGLPYYVTFLVALINQKKYSLKIQNYNNLLIMCFIGSFSYFISFKSYWMYRFTALFYVPISIIFGIIFNEECNKKKKVLYFILVLLSNFTILVRWLYLMFIQGGF